MCSKLLKTNRVYIFRNTVLTMAVPDPIEKDVLWIGSFEMV